MQTQQPTHITRFLQVTYLPVSDLTPLHTIWPLFFLPSKHSHYCVVLKIDFEQCRTTGELSDVWPGKWGNTSQWPRHLYVSVTKGCSCDNSCTSWGMSLVHQQQTLWWKCVPWGKIITATWIWVSNCIYYKCYASHDRTHWSTTLQFRLAGRPTIAVFLHNNNIIT